MTALVVPRLLSQSLPDTVLEAASVERSGQGSVFASIAKFELAKCAKAVTSRSIAAKERDVPVGVAQREDACPSQ